METIGIPVAVFLFILLLGYLYQAFREFLQRNVPADAKLRWSLPIIIAASVVLILLIVDCVLADRLAFAKSASMPAAYCNGLARSHVTLLLSSRWGLFAFYLMRNGNILSNCAACFVHRKEQQILSSIGLCLYFLIFVLIQSFWNKMDPGSAAIPDWLKFSIYSTDLLYNLCIVIIFILPLRRLRNNEEAPENLRQTLNNLIIRDAVIVSIQWALVFLAFLGTILSKDSEGRNYWPTILAHLVVGMTMILINQKLDLCRKDDTDSQNAIAHVNPSIESAL